MVPRASYDVGHLFSGRVGNGSGGGGVAFLSSVCNNNDNGGTTGPLKAGGGSAVPNPQGNSWVNLLAHEFTHQFNADHTWSGNSGFCTPSQWSGPPAGRTSYEPGGGSTIVSYSDICADDNIPNLGNIDYYHTISIKEVDDYIESGGVTCEANVASGNSVPVPSSSTAGCTPNYNLPIRTPFIIKGSATDANDPANQLTYTWEQFNKSDTQFDPIDGPTTKNSNNEIYPIIRSFFPSSSAERTIPQMSTILSGNYNGDAQNAATLTQANWQGELLPEMTSTLTMRLTVRDNNATSGGVEHADATIQVTNSGGPFAVTSPNGGENRTAGVPFNVTWNKVGTDGAPFNCANVEIHLSTDGGMTFPTFLGSHTNDGSASVTIPANQAATGTARIRISCGNDCFRFFDISNANFNILAGNQCTPPTITLVNVTQPTCNFQLGTIVVTAIGNGPFEYSNDNGTSWQTSNTFSLVPPGGYNIKVRQQSDPSCMTSYGQNPVMINAPTGCCPNIGDIIITEIMNDPNAVSDTNGEWFEVYNTTNAPIDMNGWTIKDDGTDNHVIGSSVVVPPMSYAVLGRNDNASQNGGVTVNYEYSSFILGNSGDEVVLLCGGNEIDRVNYDGGPNFPDPTGASMNLDPGSFNATANNTGSNWCESTTIFGSSDKGSPGSANINCSAPCTPPVVTAPTVTQPTCANPTGTIVVNATGTGTLEYSVDNGATWQTSNTFSGLAPGSYSIKVRLQNDPSCMAAYGQNPVVLVAPTGCCTPPTVTAPTVTQPTCANPTGTIVVNATGTGTLEYSVDNGATWQTSNTFSGLAPGSYSIKVRLQNDPSCMTAYNQNPVVLSITGNTVYNGNVFFTTQMQIDAWSSCYTVINGTVTISGIGISNLNALSNIVQITGNLTIQMTGLANMTGLNSLTTVGGSVQIFYNITLISLQGLEALNAVGSNLNIYYNFLLDDCCAIYNLLNNGGVAGASLVFFNKTGCNSVLEITTNCAPPPPLIADPTNHAFQDMTQTFGQKEGMVLYPNPAKGNVTLGIGNAFDVGQLRVVDFAGRTVLSQQLQSNTARQLIHLTDWRPGIYLVQVLLDGQTISQKLIVN